MAVKIGLVARWCFTGQERHAKTVERASKKRATIDCAIDGQHHPTIDINVPGIARDAGKIAFVTPVTDGKYPHPRNVAYATARGSKLPIIEAPNHWSGSATCWAHSQRRDCSQGGIASEATTGASAEPA